MTPLIIQDQFGFIQNIQMSTIPQTIFLAGTFFAASYSKRALPGTVSTGRISNSTILISLDCMYLFSSGGTLY